MFEIIQSETFKGWRTSLENLQAVAKVNARIRRLSAGNPGDVKPVGKGISEQRIDYGPGYRVYFKHMGLCCWQEATRALRRRTLPWRWILRRTGRGKS